MTTTENIFDDIAPGWYNVRHWTRFRKELDALADRWHRGKLLNIGCAHGPDFLPFKANFLLYGVDISLEMLKFARRYARKFNFAANLFVADAAYLPFADGTFDWAISVATYHHLKGKASRKMALSELNRALKPGGEAFITVWNRWQPRFWLRGKEVTVPWRTGGRTVYRYHYLFSHRELKRLVEESGFEVLKSFPGSSGRFPFGSFSQNICLLVRKGNV